MIKMTGTVVKFTEKYIVLIMPDGSFKNVKRLRGQTPLIGERLAVNIAKAPFSKYHWVAVAAVFCLIFAAFLRFVLFMPDNTNPAYIVALDINPSIEIHTDDQFNIMNVTSLNGDGEIVIGDTRYSGMELFAALESIVGKSISNGYLVQEKTGFIKITVISMQGNGFQYENRIRTTLQGLLEKRKIDAMLEIGTASAGILEEARRSNLSVNRYILYQDLIEKGIDVTAEDAANMPLKELKDFGTLQKNGAESSMPDQNNNAGNTGAGAVDAVKDSKGDTGENGSETPDDSNSDASEVEGNPVPYKDNSKQNEIKGEESSGISGTTSGGNADNGSGSTDVEANPDINGEGNGTVEGDPSTGQSTGGTVNPPSPIPLMNGSQTDEAPDPGQAPEGTNSEGTGGGSTDSGSMDKGTSGSVQNSGKNQ